MLMEQVSWKEGCLANCGEGSQIVLQIESADHSWASLFLQPETSDYKIEHRERQYPVHRNVIFKNISLHALDHQKEEGKMTLASHFNPSMVQGVLSCLYSLELRICRSQALDVLDIVHSLHIPRLQRKLEQDIKQNIEDYELFQLLERALLMSMVEIEELCLNQLEMDCYEQMCYEKYELLECNEETFKYVLTHHNERREEDHTFGQGPHFIHHLIQEYTDHHNYSQKDHLALLRDLQEAPAPGLPSFTKMKLAPLQIGDRSPMDIKLYTPRAVSREPLLPKLNSLSPFQDHSSTRSMIFDLTYMGEKKRKSSRGEEGLGLAGRVVAESLLEKNREMANEGEETRQVLLKMGKVMRQRQTESRNNKFKLGEIEGLLEECENELMSQNRTLMLLEVRTDKLADESGSEEEEQSFEMGSNGSSSSDSEGGRANSPKAENEKDQTLRVSLIQSKWVAV